MDNKLTINHKTEKKVKLLESEEFKQSLEQVTAKALEIYDLNISQNDIETIKSEPDKYSISFALHRLSDQIKNIFSTEKLCVDLMNTDEIVKLHIGSLVGSHMYCRRFDLAEDYLLCFIESYYFETRFWKRQKSFEVACNEFINFFYRNSVDILKKCVLHNFDFEGDNIELEPGIQIRKITEKERIEYNLPKKEELGKFPYERRKTDDFNLSDFLIEARVQGQKHIYQKERVLPKHDNEEDLNSVLYDIITSLRILKPTSTYCDNEIRTSITSFCPGQSGHFMDASFFNSYTPGGISKLSIEEAAKLKQLYLQYKGSSDRFKLAASRLCYGMERKKIEDKIIDYFIGLEAAYLPGIFDELTFRLSLRCALMLNQHQGSNTKEIYQFIKKMYDVRGAIVHGEIRDLDKLTHENCNKLENILRATLNLWLFNPEICTHEYLEKLCIQR